MAASYVTLTLDRYDGEGNPYVKGSATFTPSLEFPDVADQMLVGMAPVTATFRAGSLPTVRLIANDTAGPQGVSLPGWTWNVTYSSDTPGSPAATSYYILSTNGSTQRLSSLVPVPAPQPGYGYVSSFNTRTGAVTAQSGDYSAFYDATGAASAAQAASLQKSSNLSDLASVSTARTNLGLGSAATQASSAFDAAGAAAAAQAASLPLTTGTASAGMVPLATGSGNASAWGFNGAGATVVVPKPTGATATDTPNFTTAIAALTANATLLVQDGVYQVDSNALVIQNLSNITVTSSGATVIQQAPNRAGLVNNTTGDLFVIADCTDVRVTGNITFDGNRDVVSPVTLVTAAVASGQPSVTVAAGQGTRFLAGTALNLRGGLGSGEQNQAQSLTVQSVTAGGGSGGGDLVTFTANITSTYNTVSGSLANDPYGPYGATGAYLTFYQPQVTNTVAGRSLTTEDQQNGLHFLNCKRVRVLGITSRNLWSSPVKIGAGIGAQANTYANSCYDVTVSGCHLYHGYDQGVSVWISQEVTVTGNWIDSPGWAGVSLTQSDYCTVTGNEIKNVTYFGAGQAGGGVVTEGGIRNVITANVITCPLVSTVAGGISIQGWNTNAKWGLSSTNTNWPTLSSFTEQGTAGGTSIQWSATAGLMAGGRYSIFDGYRTEAVTVASVVDGTHLTFNETLKFSHAAGCYLSPRIAQGNTVKGNVIDLTGVSTGASGIFSRGSVRSHIEGNEITGWTNNGIDLNANASFCPPSSFICGDGSQVIGNTLSGGANQPVTASGVSHLIISGNKVYGTPQAGSNRGIALGGVTDSQVTGNQVYDIVGSDAIRLTTGGPSSAPCARVTVTGNVCERANGNGISLVAADSCPVEGNTCQSNTAWGISLSGCTNSPVSGNTANSNKSGGITLANNASTGTTGCRVTVNTCRDDGTGVNVTTGATFTQPHGIVESGNSNLNVFTGNECDANATDQLVTVGANSTAFANIISGAVSGPVGVNYDGTFGDGSDGTATLDGTATVTWASKAGSVYTMSRDACLTSLTVNNGVTLNTSGWRVFCAGTVTNNGTIACNGGSAASATGGAAAFNSTPMTANAGGNGATGAGAGGGNSGTRFATGTGSAGGTGSSGAGGGTNGSRTSSTALFRNPVIVLAACSGWSGATQGLSGACGGGGGGGDGANSGGGGGAGGGVVAILAWSVVNNGTIAANGGNGFTPVAGNCGGGGGGGGGLILIYTLSAWTAGTTSVTGGTHGSGVGTGTAGTDGTAGTVLNVIVQ